jgi:FkbM family methyltransferase
LEKEQIYKILNEAYFSENMDEKYVLKHLPDLLKAVRIFIDIGASLGQYTFYVNQMMHHSKIYAIEADPIRFEKLKSNCTQWQKNSTNQIECIKGAISDSDGKLTFFSTESNVSGGLFKHEIAEKNLPGDKKTEWTEIEVDSFTLDNKFKDQLPDLIKLDVEGSELRVLKGCKKILQEGNCVFLVELHSWVDPEGQSSAAEVIEFMNKFNYKRYNFYGKSLFLQHIPTQLWLKLKIYTFIYKVKRRIFKQ